MVYICTKFGENLEGFQSYGADTISILIIGKGHNSTNIARGVTVLVYAHRLIMVNICTKLSENILKDFRFMERTRFVMDRQSHTQTNRQTFMGKAIYLQRRGGETSFG